MEESTYLEDYLQSVELLPNDIRRDFEMMREHDRECVEGTRDINDAHARLLQILKNIDSSDNNASNAINLYEQILNDYSRVKTRSSQKVHLAGNMLKDLEQYIRKLDMDLAFFEHDLRGCGEFEQLARGYDPGSEVSAILYTRIMIHHECLLFFFFFL